MEEKLKQAKELLKAKNQVINKATQEAFVIQGRIETLQELIKEQK